tara:strand:- start:841 stop:1095 length:255 start_codon:yes stop_codon:yes gene_type:complete
MSEKQIRGGILSMHKKIISLEEKYDLQMKFKNKFKRKYMTAKREVILLKKQRAKLVQLLKLEQHINNRIAKELQNIDKPLGRRV